VVFVGCEEVRRLKFKIKIENLFYGTDWRARGFCGVIGVGLKLG
jgi:hypothetical protein